MKRNGREVKGKLKGHMFYDFDKGLSNVPLTSEWSKTTITSF